MTIDIEHATEAVRDPVLQPSHRNKTTPHTYHQKDNEKQRGRKDRKTNRISKKKKKKEENSTFICSFLSLAADILFLKICKHSEDASYHNKSQCI